MKLRQGAVMRKLSSARRSDVVQRNLALRISLRSLLNRVLLYAVSPLLTLPQGIAADPWRVWQLQPAILGAASKGENPCASEFIVQLPLEFLLVFAGKYGVAPPDHHI